MNLPGGRSLRRLLHPAYKSLERTACVLRYLFVEITQRCNLSCLHCGSDCGREAQLEELSTDEWLGFFRYLGRTFDRRELVVVVTGGEPFCAPGFSRITAGLRDEGLHWGLVTNGWSLTEANVARLVADGASSMTVSLDGLRGSHDWLRGRAGSFDRAVAGIRAAAASKLTHFDVVTCANPRNLAELDEVQALLAELGVRAWRLFTIFPKGRAQGAAGLRLSDEQLRWLFGWMREKRRALSGTGFRLDSSCEGSLPPGLDAEVRDEPYFCRAGINVGSVLCDGSIEACPNITRTLVQGNIRTDDFKAVWEERFQPFRDRRWMQQGPCADCASFSRCEGNSMHLWDAEAGRPALCHREVLAPLETGGRGG